MLLTLIVTIKSRLVNLPKKVVFFKRHFFLLRPLPLLPIDMVVEAF